MATKMKDGSERITSMCWKIPYVEPHGKKIYPLQLEKYKPIILRV